MNATPEITITTVTAKNGQTLYRAASEESTRFAGDGAVVSGLQYTEDAARADWLRRANARDA